MANYCGICGKKIGLLKGYVQIHDGCVCTSCWASAGLDMGFKSMITASRKTLNQVRDLIEIELLKGEAAKDRARQEAAEARVAADNAETNPYGGKPIDINIKVEPNGTTHFKCTGEPVINFIDLVKGNEMIIGDGFINNQCAITLPEVRIACEFDPPIIDSGLIYYKEGTFTSGMNERFEIDDPPVNLAEYAEIKSPKAGKVKFTLFFGEKELQSVECNMKIAPAPEEQMQQLMQVILYEKEKNSSGPVNVFLYAREDGTYDMDLMRQPELLYSMYSNGKEQLIGDVYVTNETRWDLRDVKFEAKFTSNILSPVKILLGNVPAGESVSFEVDDPAIDIDKLERLTDIETCTATYKLLVAGRTIAESTGKITICPYDQWNASLILLPAYMTPNHPNIISVLQEASQWMLVNGMNPSLEGYQSDGKRVEEMVGAVYNAVKEANIIYSNPPASFFGPQRIRLCESVLQQKFATCMDMTILFASCLESFGLNPVLITAPGHIFAGVWLTAKGRLQEPVVSDAKMIQKYIEDGKLVAVECTAMNVGNEADYEKAKEIANQTIKALADNNIENHECIDVQYARAMGVRPLPMRVHETAQVAKKKSAKPKKAEQKPEKEIVPEEVMVTEKLEEQPKPESVSVESPVTVSSFEKVEYVEFNEDLTHITIDNFYDKQNKKIIKDAIAKIVEVEGPISQPALIRTLINTTSLGRASKQINEHLDKLVAAADVKITRQNGVRFLWEYGTEPAVYTKYRMRTQRNPEDVCKYELKNAVCCLIQENGPMTKAEIIKAMTAMFGYSRSSKKIEDGAIAAIKAARELKAIEQNEEGKFVIV